MTQYASLTPELNQRLRARFREEMTRRGYPSANYAANKLGLHPNTVRNFLDHGMGAGTTIMEACAAHFGWSRVWMMGLEDEVASGRRFDREPWWPKALEGAECLRDESHEQVPDETFARVGSISVEDPPTLEPWDLFELAKFVHRVDGRGGRRASLLEGVTAREVKRVQLTAPAQLARGAPKKNGSK